MNATWPLARLRVTREALTLKVIMLGTFEFEPADVIVIEPYGCIPLVGRGVRIRHRRSEYSEEIIFWYPHRSVEPIIRALSSLGYKVA